MRQIPRVSYSSDLDRRGLRRRISNSLFHVKGKGEKKRGKRRRWESATASSLWISRVFVLFRGGAEARSKLRA